MAWVWVVGSSVGGIGWRVVELMKLELKYLRLGFICRLVGGSEDGAVGVGCSVKEELDGG